MTLTTNQLLLAAGQLALVSAWFLHHLIQMWRRRRAVFHAYTAFEDIVEDTQDEVIWPRLESYHPTWWEMQLDWSEKHQFNFVKRRYVFTLAVLGVFFVVLGRLDMVFFLLSGVAAYVVWVVTAAKKQKQRFVDQLPDALQAMVQSLRAGYNLQQSIGLLARESAEPTRKVFAALHRSYAYNIPLNQALEWVRPQLPLNEWDLVADSLVIQGDVGGNLIPLFDQLQETLRQRITIAREVKSSTMSGRLSGSIITGMVPLGFLFLKSVNPEYLAPLTDTLLGKCLMLLAVVMTVIGFSVIRKIVDIEY